MEESIRHIQMYGIVRGNGYSTNGSGKVYTIRKPVNRAKEMQ